MEFNDVVFETFTYLSAKALYKYASVSKECKGFTDEDLFIKKQCHNMQLKGDSSFFIQPQSCQRYKDKVELHSLDAKAGIPQIAQEFLSSTSRVLASSNGLLCCRNVCADKGTLFMYNPVTQNWFPIPSPSGLNPSFDYKIVFECNSGSMKFPHDYMLMIVMEEVESDWASNLVWKIYSPEEGIWKDKGMVNFGKRNINYEMPVYHNGTVNFITDCFPYLEKGSPYYWPYIVSLNVTDGSQKLLSIPKNSRKGLSDMSCRLGIFKWGSARSSSESICLVKVWKTKCCLWVLEDYNLSSWTRKLKKRVRAMGFIEHNPRIAGFTVLNGELLLLATEERVYSYDLDGDDEKVKVISGHTCGENVFFHSYSSTLRPCGNGAESILTF